MASYGILCPEVPGHINPMIGLAEALRSRGHRIAFFLLGNATDSVTAAGFEVVPLRSPILTPEDHRIELQKLGVLSGLSALKQTINIGARATAAVLDVGPKVIREAGVTALIVDQTMGSGGTVADELRIPFATICNALMLHSEPAVPPFFTHWRYRDVWWGRIRNRLAWAVFEGKLAPILQTIRVHRRRLGLPDLHRFSDTWSNQLQITQQPAVLEFPRHSLPSHLHFVGSLQRPRDAHVSFPWERLDGRPLIYASLGTLQNRLAGLFQMIAAACDPQESQLVISTGGGIAPDLLGQLPGDPIVVQFAPQLDLIRRATLVITHAGLNTTLESLAAGVPMVAIPITNDQPGVGARIAWTGAGETIPASRVTVAVLRRLIDQLMGEKSYRIAADRLRESIRLAGGAARAAELVETRLHE